MHVIVVLVLICLRKYYPRRRNNESKERDTDLESGKNRVTKNIEKDFVERESEDKKIQGHGLKIWHNLFDFFVKPKA